MASHRDLAEVGGGEYYIKARRGGNDPYILISPAVVIASEALVSIL